MTLTTSASRANRNLAVVLALTVSVLLGCASSSRGGVVSANPGLKDKAAGERLHVALDRGAAQAGLASWYGPQFHGRQTANGETYDMDGISAAHKTLPFGTVVRVKNLDNGKALDVRVNDRGPFIRGRILDLSRGAAERLGLIGPGVARVEVALVSWPDRAPLARRQGGSTARSMGPWVQAGAFRDHDRATALAAELKMYDQHFKVYSDDGWHRVQARLSTEEAARKLIVQLAGNGIEAVSRRP